MVPRNTGYSISRTRVFLLVFFCFTLEKAPPPTSTYVKCGHSGILVSGPDCCSMSLRNAMVDAYDRPDLARLNGIIFCPSERRCCPPTKPTGIFFGPTDEYFYFVDRRKPTEYTRMYTINMCIPNQQAEFSAKPRKTLF